MEDPIHVWLVEEPRCSIPVYRRCDGSWRTCLLPAGKTLSLECGFYDTWCVLTRCCVRLQLCWLLQFPCIYKPMFWFEQWGSLTHSGHMSGPWEKHNEHKRNKYKETLSAQRSEQLRAWEEHPAEGRQGGNHKLKVLGLELPWHNHRRPQKWGQAAGSGQHPLHLPPGIHTMVHSSRETPMPPPQTTREAAIMAGTMTCIIKNGGHKETSMGPWGLSLPLSRYHNEFSRD